MPKLTLTMLSGFTFRRRGVGSIEGEDWLDAGKVFRELSGKVEEEIRNRIDHWLSGRIHDRYHHGFPNDRKHEQCYVFKHQSLRLYGFLCNPKPKTDKGFRLCVLTEAVSKHQWNTEITILNRAMQMLNDLRAKEAIAVIYPEHGEVNTSWKN